MDGDGPCQAQRILPEHALNLGLDFFGFLVDDVARVLPFLRRHGDVEVISGTMDGDLFLVYALHPTDSAVVILSERRAVVFDKHHLRARFERQYLARGIAVLGKCASDFGFEVI